MHVRNLKEFEQYFHGDWRTAKTSVPYIASVKCFNQSKFIFQAITNNYKIINVTALERLSEKHYAH